MTSNALHYCENDEQCAALQSGSFSSLVENAHLYAASKHCGIAQALPQVYVAIADGTSTAVEGAICCFKHANRESQAHECSCSCKARD
jgi:hypothetical protein